MRKTEKIKILNISEGWVEYCDVEVPNSQGSISLHWFEGRRPSVNDKYTLVTNFNDVISVSKVTNTMYARCLDARYCRLVENFEYEVVSVHVCAGYGESLFYLLDDGLLYASCHFSVTYFK
jgi:hypothetical protein